MFPGEPQDTRSPAHSRQKPGMVVMIDFRQLVVAASILLAATLAHPATVAIEQGLTGDEVRGQRSGFPRRASFTVGPAMESVSAVEDHVPLRTVEASQVSVPGTLSLFAIGGLALLLLRRKVHNSDSP